MASNCRKYRMEPIDFSLDWPCVLWLAAAVVPWHTFNLIGLALSSPGLSRGIRLAVFRPRR